MLDSSNYRILVIAPHPDDEILGLGGSICKLTDQGHEVTILTVSGHLPPLYDESVFIEHKKQALRAHEIVGVRDSVFLEIPATLVRDTPVAELNGLISHQVERVRPQIVFFPFPDRHIDHKVIFDSAMVAIRPVKYGSDIIMAACYEVLSETHWNAPAIEPVFNPNITIDISGYIDRKLEALACFEGEIMVFPGPRSIEATDALAKFRGTQAGFAYGEALQLVRLKI